jgi:Flp pilus assembly protein TadD
MARTLAPFRNPGQPLDRAHHNPFAALGLVLDTYSRDGRWYHRASRVDEDGKRIANLDLPVNCTIGSGSHGFSYLSIRDGFVVQTGVSWFSQKQRWDLSPGFGEALVFGRMVPADCLFCHANRVEPIPGLRNRFREPVFAAGHGIGCERCHGPAEKHVAERTATSIVNPARLPWKLRENVCEQCHLQGNARITRKDRNLVDWRPGLPLEAYLSVFVPDDSSRDQHANNHVVQMHQSVCFQKSRDDNKLGCVSCHNPHVHITKERRVEHYRARCLTCHQDKGCKLHVAERWRQKRDSCIDCHMPRFGPADIAHAALTDHRILRRRRATPTAEPEPTLQMANFYADRNPVGPLEAKRELALAMEHTISFGPPTLRLQAPRAIPLLNEVLRRTPDDLEARKTRAALKRLQGQSYEALRDYEMVLAAFPRRESALYGATLAARSAGLSRTAKEYARRLVEISPYQANYRSLLAWVLREAGDLEEALVQARAQVELAPISEEAQSQLTYLLLRTGRRTEARAQLELLRRMKAPHLEFLEKAFAQGQ